MKLFEPSPPNTPTTPSPEFPPPSPQTEEEGEAEDIPRAHSEQEQTVLYNPLQPPPLTPYDEMLTPIDNRFGTHTSNCGHCIHIECFQRYFNSLLKRHIAQQTYEGQGKINISGGEFLCPNVSNSLTFVLF